MTRNSTSHFCRENEKATMVPAAIRRLIGLFVLAELLGGCAIGPHYRRPDDLAPASYREPPVTVEQAVSATAELALMPWWEVFKDPQLQTLIHTALENNQDLKIATARVEEVRALLGAVSAALYPQLDVSGSAARTRTPDLLRTKDSNGELSPAHTNAFSALLDLSYEVDLWGGVRRVQEAGRAELLATEEARQAVISTLVTEVARAYFSLLELDREIEITSETLRAREKTLELMELRRKQGISSDLEVSRYRAEVASTQATLAVLKQITFQSENALSILLGLPPQEIQRSVSLKDQPPVPTVPVGLPAELLERRPDVRAAEQQLVSTTARIGVAKAAFFPRIALTAEHGYRSLELTDLLESNSLGWLIAGAVTQPIFEGGRIRSNYRATLAQQEQALQNYRKTVLQALREVSDALIAKQQSAEVYRQSEEMVKALQSSVRLSDLRYRAGQASYLELLNAEQQLFAAELLLEQARLDELLASVRLYKALGGGVEVESPEANSPPGSP